MQLNSTRIYETERTTATVLTRLSIRQMRGMDGDYLKTNFEAESAFAKKLFNLNALYTDNSLNTNTHN